jgi:hypothetical protein
MRHHYVYYSYEDFGRGYIGSRTCDCLPEEDRYFGSFYDKTFNPNNKIILEVFDTREEALDAEIKLHQFYDVARNSHFANQSKQTSTGFSAEGVVRSDEYKQKMSESMKKREYQKEWVEKAKQNRRSFDGEQNPFYQKTHKQETRERISNTLKEYFQNNTHPFEGKKHSEESKKKMSESRKGEKNYFYGKSPSEETRRKQSEARKLWWERKRQQQNEEA